MKSLRDPGHIDVDFDAAVDGPWHIALTLDEVVEERLVVVDVPITGRISELEFRKTRYSSRRVRGGDAIDANQIFGCCHSFIGFSRVSRQAE